MYYRNLSSPISVQVETTEICDNRCIHCYNYWRDETQVSKKHTFSADQLSFVVNKLVEDQVFSVTLTGGEPLLYWRNLPPAIERLRSNGVEVSLNSNLASLTEEIALALKKSGLTSILTSVLSCDEKIHDAIANRPGAWQRTIAGINTAVSAGFRIGANMVLLRDNFSTLYGTAAFLKNLGVKSFSATKASPALNSRNFDDHLISNGELRESLASLERIKQELGMAVDILECYPLCLIGDVVRFQHFSRRSCTAGVTTCTISPTGDVRPCSHADMVYGNIFKESLHDIWLRMEDWRRGEYIPAECHECKFLSACSGGCRMEAKFRGNIHGRDPYMTGPHDVTVPTLTPSTGKEISYIRGNQLFELAADLRTRREDFGAVVRTGRGVVVLVDADGYKLLQILSENEYFSLNQIMRDVDVKPEPLHAFLAAMAKKGVVREVCNKGRR